MELACKLSLAAKPLMDEVLRMIDFINEKQGKRLPVRAGFSLERTGKFYNNSEKSEKNFCF